MAIPCCPERGLIKVIIIVLLIGVVLSLFSSLTFLFKDTERRDSKRALYALGIRITLAAALLLTVFYGFYSGQLRMGASAPWHEPTTARPHGDEIPTALENINK